jgi:NitT/TauT family transport system permease protein
LELPFGAIALIANSMMSWAGGWFFLMASEQFVLGTSNLRLPGLGSYLAGAAEVGDGLALTLGLLALVAVIVLLDQLLWRPLVAWSDRFKFEQSGGDAPTSAILDALQGSTMVDWTMRGARTIAHGLARLAPKRSLIPEGLRRGKDDGEEQSWVRHLPGICVGMIFLWMVGWGGIATFHALAGLPEGEWKLVWVSAGATFLRTLIALALGALWTIPVGVAIGTNPTWSRRAQPVVQVIASIPATAVFPVFLLALLGLPGGLNIAAVALMLLGTQWYVLFNVIAGAMAIPSDLKEAAITYRVNGWMRWRTLTLPAIFPYLVTGMITATGGAWNASIVSEYVTFANKKVSTVGLGAVIARAADGGNFPLLLAATLVMAAIVIAGNRLVWRRLYRLAESRYRLG